MGSTDHSRCVYVRTNPGASIPGMQVGGIRMFIMASGVVPLRDVPTKLFVGIKGRSLSYIILPVLLAQMFEGIAPKILLSTFN